MEEIEQMVAECGSPAFPEEHSQTSIIKSGWLWRQSRFLKAWKRSWFVLWSSGRLMFYEDQNTITAKDSLNIPFENADILSVEDCLEILPPDGVSSECVLGLSTETKIWYMATKYPEEAIVWRLAFERAKEKGWAKHMDDRAAYTITYPRFPCHDARVLHGSPREVVAIKSSSALEKHEHSCEHD